MAAGESPHTRPSPSEPGRAKRDLLLIGAAVVVAWVAADQTEAFERFVAWSAEHEDWQLDEALVAVMALTAGFAVFAFRRWQDFRRERVVRQKAERELHALHEVLQVCAKCRKIRVDEHGWIDPVTYVAEREHTPLSHGLCPACLRAAERQAGL